MMSFLSYRSPCSTSSAFHCMLLANDGRKASCIVPRRLLSSTSVSDCRFFSTKFISATVRCLSRLFKCTVRADGIKTSLPPLFSVAPMMDWTDNHYRTLARLISQHAWLYTEMIVAETIVYQKNNLDRFLEFPETQHPIVLQIGGSNVANLAKAVELANTYGYDEINLNCGCPSQKVAGHGCFGAQLMLNPKLVGEAMAAISANSDVPVSVKCRIGVDDHDTYDKLCAFIDTVSSLSPTRHFIIHARKALLKGLSPDENRTIPPLKYEYVFGLIRDFPHLHFTLNGGITQIPQVKSALWKGVYGVMIGRAAYNTPWATLGHVDTAVYGVPSRGLSRRQILQEYQKYADSVIGKYGINKPSIRNVVKPLLNLFHSEPGARVWKRKVDEALRHCQNVHSLLEESIEVIPDFVLDASPPIQIYDDESFSQIEMSLPEIWAATSSCLEVEDIHSYRKVIQNV
ncbi:uncharacterized protein LOC131049069 isoform X1 [Cryptomeria japonica]|uniref:uncharacterized protein LOC131049069 isoform X1 n=1 Tax=Cryptomeria japonica TaxID=3369 RepID=UPI0025ABD14E|nr:uncharacterized protein LOC131049069 isoform X1 [Cryptomeria japonica]